VSATLSVSTKKECAVRLKIVAGLLLAAVLALSGCAASGSNTESGARSGASAVSLKFTGQTLDGAAYDGQQLASKPTVLWFWAPWCPTCRAQAGRVETIAKEYAGQVKVTKLDVDANIQTATRFNVRSIPMLLFFKDGKVVDQIVGAVPRQAIEAKLKQHVA